MPTAIRNPPAEITARRVKFVKEVPKVYRQSANPPATYTTRETKNVSGAPTAPNRGIKISPHRTSNSAQPRVIAKPCHILPDAAMGTFMNAFRTIKSAAALIIVANRDAPSKAEPKRTLTRKGEKSPMPRARGSVKAQATRKFATRKFRKAEESALA